MAFNCLNSHKKNTAAHKRGRLYDFSEQTGGRRNIGVPRFPVPPPYSQANGVPIENSSIGSIQHVAVLEHVQLFPVGAFQHHMPPPVYDSNAYCLHRAMNPAPQMPNFLYHPQAYSNHNGCNQVIINNTSHAMINSFPLTNLATVMQQSNNALENATQNVNAVLDSVSGADNDPKHTNDTPSCPSPLVPITSHFDDFIQTALEGCKMAVSLASSNQKRPCFKKIDTLCANLQLDLVKADNVMANINSQGLAWAVKDFIFVFTRIMNAWIIIKGYVYGEPAGLVDIQRELCPKFLDAFARWHLATHDLTHSLIESFVRLDKLAKSQRVGVGAHVKAKQSTFSTENENTSDEQLDETSESCNFPKTDGSYIRTGLYETLKTSAGLFGGHKIAYPLSDPETSEPYIVVSLKSSTSDPDEYEAENKHNLSDRDNATKSLFDRRLLEKLHGTTTASAIGAILDKVFEIDEAKYFFILNFTKNYFPDFHLAAKQFSDLRTIITNAEMGVYSKVDTLVEDLQQIVYSCKHYIETIEMFELLKLDEKIAQKQSTVQEQEAESIYTMQSFVAKMELVLSYARATTEDTECTDSCHSFLSVIDAFVGSSETLEDRID